MRCHLQEVVEQFGVDYLLKMERPTACDVFGCGLQDAQSFPHITWIGLADLLIGGLEREVPCVGVVTAKQRLE
jgi:hypothetical protein